MAKYKPKNDAERRLVQQIYTEEGAYGKPSIEEVLSRKIRGMATPEERAEKDKALSIWEQRSDLAIEKHREAVANYKRAWRNKSALWKLFHMKYSPKKKPLDKMNRHVINNITNTIINKTK